MGEAGSPDPRRRRVLGGVGGALLLGGSRTAGAAPDSWRAAGAGFTNYGVPPDDAGLVRWITRETSAPGNGASWTPLHALEGAITPNGLHFERHHNGVPAIDRDTWSLALTGRVSTPLALGLDALRRRPQRSRIAFLECGGNSHALWREEPVQQPAGWLHGLVSSGEWSGVPLAALLAEAGPRPDASWLIATGLDAAGVSVSLALADLPAEVARRPVPQRRAAPPRARVAGAAPGTGARGHRQRQVARPARARRSPGHVALRHRRLHRPRPGRHRPALLAGDGGEVGG